MTKPLILVTGGPVAVNLDAVKIITNKFKGGRMLALANDLSMLGARVIYLSSLPPPADWLNLGVELERHTGFDDYMAKVSMLSTVSDAVVLGAAVANLIPDRRWQELNLKAGKFPSHNYDEGDPVPVLFRIAPRIINRVREAAPRTKLIGFKLLSGVSSEDLIAAAGVTQRESMAHLVVANDATRLDDKFGVTPEGGSFGIDNLPELIYGIATDEHYQTRLVDNSPAEKEEARLAYRKMKKLIDLYSDRLLRGTQPDGMIFGCIAEKFEREPGFLISGRGKRDLHTRTIVRSVNHDDLIVESSQGLGKASLNAPLIDRIFTRIPDARAVVHCHECLSEGEWEHLPYYQPGTVRDSQRDFPTEWHNKGQTWMGQIRFYIKGHGEFLVLK